MAFKLDRAALLEPQAGAYISAAARGLLSQAVLCADTIERRVKTSSGPYYVMLGEVHDEALHGLFHLLVGLGLRDRGYNVAIGLERPHNNASAILDCLAAQAPCDMWGMLRQKLHSVSRDDVMHQQITNSFTHTRFNNMQGKICSGLWRDAGITVAYNDAAMAFSGDMNNPDMDVTDAVLLDALDRAHLPAPTGEAVSSTSALGVLYRNHVMAALAHDHAAAREADVYIQIVGDAHVAGVKGQLPYQESLVGLLDAKLHGQKAIGIPTLCNRFNGSALPGDAGANIDRSFALDGPGFDVGQDDAENLWLETILPQILPAQKVSYALDRANGPLAPMRF